MNYYEMAMSQGIRLYGTDEAAEFLGTTRRTVQDHARRGKLPGFVYRRRWYFTEPALTKFKDKYLKTSYSEDQIFGRD